MSEPTFERQGTTRLYWLDHIVAFLATDAAGLGDKPALTQTWTDPGGIYLFLGAPTDEQFVTRLERRLELHYPNRRPRFLWVEDPNVDPVGWDTNELWIDSRTGVTEVASFQLADYTLTVVGGSGVAPGQVSGSWGFVLADSPVAPGCTFSRSGSSFSSTVGTGRLSMMGGSAGTWQFDLEAAAEPGGRTDVFRQLRAGIRYFTPDPDSEGDVVILEFGVFRQPTDTAIGFEAQIDPLRALDPKRTALTFASDTPVLPSEYATVFGHGVNLQPREGARLVLGFSPFSTDEEGEGSFYFVPEGSFSATVARPESRTDGDNPEVERVVCGISGLEYLGLPEGSALTFVAARPAYAPLASGTGENAALTGHGTTSWVAVESPADKPAIYYSQPEDAPLFTESRTGPPADEPPDTQPAAAMTTLLDFFEIPAAVLPSPAGITDASAVEAFPMAPFRGLPADEVERAVAIEQLALAPTRRNLLPEPSGFTQSEAALPRVGTTPQGLGVGVGRDGSSWEWLGIGHTGAPADKPDLYFSAVSGPFQQAMQTNNLFLVLGDADKFDEHGSVSYLLSSPSLSVIAGLPNRGGIRQEVLDAVSNSGKIKDKPFSNRNAFRAAITAVVPDIREDELDVFRRFAGQLTPTVGGWPFRLSPDNWGDTTFLLVKFVLGRSIADLVSDISTWAWPEAAGKGGPAEAQKTITQIIADAVAAPETSPYADFAAVAHDPNWTGILALSVEVPLDQLPAELQVLAAGINPAQFRAHHFGISATPYQVTDGGLQFDRSSMFGLIDYENPEDQYFSENIPFAFRVLQLTVGIRNSIITTFTSRAELLVNRLFGAPTRLLPTSRGNNVVLDGAHQRQKLPDGTEHDTYVFSMSGDNTFLLDGLVLQAVELTAVQLVTAQASDPVTNISRVDAVFQISGNLSFYEPPDFDPFCWGSSDPATPSSLRFGNLGIAMRFNLADPANTTEFTVKDGNLSFDQANSIPRPDSLVARFPIRLSGLVATADPKLSQGAPPQTPADLGYISVSAPLQQSTLAQPWYGLDYTIDLGSLGALSGSKSLAIQVLVAWSPGAGGTDPAVYLGVKLPGAKGLFGVSLPLQGVIEMGFKGIEFLVDNAKSGRSYTLRLRDFALRFLGLAFPPGHNDVILFGNPDQGDSSKLGWYLAYASDSDPKKPAAPPKTGELTSIRRTLGTGH